MFIYQIFNKIYNKSYVGLSTKMTFNERYRNGKWWLRTHNKYLKRAAQKYGIDNFTIKIVEDNIIDIKTLGCQEIFWINKIDCYFPKGYNFPFPDVVEVNGKKYKIKYIDTGEIIEIRNLTKFCEDNDIGCSAMNAMLIGRQKQSHGYCLPDTIIPLIKQTLKNPIILENIYTNEKILINNIKQFCKERNLKYNSISRVIHGYKDRKSYKGWKLPETQLKEKIKYKDMYFYSPENKEIFIDNLFNFCRDNNLCYNNMFYVASEKHFQYKGWKLLKNKDKDRKWHTKERVIKDINNNIIRIDNVSEFCREKQLSRFNFDKMLKGKTSEYKGYKLNEKI